MIDPASGNVLVHRPSLTIHRGLTPDVLISHSELMTEIVLQNLPWITYRLPSIAIDEQIWAALLSFHGPRLDSITLGASRPEFGGGWSNWSRAGEMARQAFHGQVLLKDFGRDAELYVFPWGEVSSSYDERSGGASIHIRYTSRAS